MQDTTSLDSSALQSLLGGSQNSLIPESLVTTLTVSFVVLNILGLLFLIAYIFTVIRKWKVQSAILDLQKDVAEIKATLKGPATTEPATVQTAEPVQTEES